MGAALDLLPFAAAALAVLSGRGALAVGLAALGLVRLHLVLVPTVDAVLRRTVSEAVGRAVVVPSRMARAGIARRPAASPRPARGPLTEAAERRGAAVVAVLSAALTAPVFWRGVFHHEEWYGVGRFNYPWHLGFMMDLVRSRQGPPHFLLEGLVWTAHAAGGPSDERWAFVALLSASAGLLGAILHLTFARVLRGVPRAPVLAAGAALLVQLLETPAALRGPSLGAVDVYLPLNVYASPSGAFMRPFGVALFLGTAHVLGRRAAPPTRAARAALVAAAVLTPLAKPSLAILLTPALVLLLAHRWWRDRRLGSSDRFLATAVLVPSLLVLAAQWLIVKTRAPAEFRGGLVVRPLDVVLRFDLYRPALWGGVLLPVLVLVLLRHRVWSDAAIRLAWACTGLAVVWVVLLAEPGAGEIGPNLTWGLQFALYILVIATVRVLVAVTAHGRDVARWRLGAAWAGVGLYAAAGLFDALCQLHVVPAAWA